MANSSILAAFERMWQHVTAALNNKSDLNHSHDEFNSMSSDKADAIKKASGEIVSLTNSVHTPLYGFKLYGKTTQNGTPTPEAPVELVSAGKDGDITVTISGEDVENQTLTVSTPNGLAGIPVATGGNYTDNNGQQWICDEVDFGRGVYVQRVNKIVFDGTEANWSLGGSSDTNYRNYCYQYWTGSDSRYYAGTYTTPCISSHFSHKTSVNSYSGTEIGTTAHGSNIYLRLGLNAQYTDVNQFKSFLAEQYAAGNPFTHIYALATPIETDLSAEQLESYASLHTNYPNTTIMNDSNAGMEVKYYTPSTAVQMVHSPSDEGKILSIDEHGCVVLSENNSVPVSTADDDGKFLRVVNGVAAWSIVPNAEEATF